MPGCVWHITHRCHNRDFLLKFERDRNRWRYWLFQARRRYGLCVLNYIATSNHVHLLVRESTANAISRSLQLIAGRVAQEYNQRKSRKGAFWEDRYFATAVQTDGHLMRCLIYIDLNMIRAGAVKHPSQWSVSGYHEIQRPPRRYRIIDHTALLDLGGYEDLEDLRTKHYAMVEEELNAGTCTRQPEWTEAVAVGSQEFVDRIAQCKVPFR